LSLHIYIDVNVIVTIINHELGNVSDCVKILSLVDNANYTVCTSPITLAISYYFAEKKKGRDGAKNLIKVLSSKLQLIDNKNNHVTMALADNRINDFEDGLHFFAATDAQCKAIITYNKSDFYYSDIPVYSPREFLEYSFC
jgi:predicted nucleic acid-binding protein